PDVHRRRSGRADGDEGLFLDHAQELTLELQGDLRDLVEEERPPMCEREETGPVAHGSSEGAAHVPEELALEQGGRESRAVDRLEWRLPTGALRVDRPCHQLLARPGFAADQHRAMRRGDASDQGEDRLHLGGHAVDAVEGMEPQRSWASQNGGMHVATL